MKRIVFLLVFLASFAAGIFAQETSGTKVIVFKTSGELSIFNTNDLTKIELSRFDKDSVEHQDYVSQVFFRNDTTYSVIPIAEIDSVAFGVRNIIEPKPGVRRLTDEEAAAITYFDGEYIRYDESELVLSENEVVYYDLITDVLPYGLCGEIGKISDYEDSKLAQLTFLDPSEVFDRFLITGDDASSANKSFEIPMQRARGNIEMSDIEIPDGEINCKLGISTDLNIGNDSYIDLVRGKGHVSFKLNMVPLLNLLVRYTTPDVGFQTESKASFCLPPFKFLYGLLSANLNFNMFVNLKGEFKTEYEMLSDFCASFDWNLNNWKSEFGPLQIETKNADNPLLKSECQIAGEIHFGGLADLSLNLPMKSAGAGVQMKLGPKLMGEFSMKIIQSLADRYDSYQYGKSTIDIIPLSLKFDTYAYIIKIVRKGGFKNMQIDRIVTALPFEYEFSVPPISIDLFPDFNSRAVLAKSNGEFVKPADSPEVVSISSYTETELPIPLDIDFEIADKDTDETIAEVDIEETLKPAEEIEETYQNIQGEIPVPEGISDERLENIVARPVINYMGYKVKAAPVNVASDMVFSPVIAVADKGGAYFVSGMTPVSQHSYDDDTYIEGNLVGVLPVDDRFRGKRTFTTIDFVDLSDLSDEKGSVNPEHPLIGEWHGVIDDEDVAIHFLDDKKGSFNGKSFTYKFNSPLQGGISIVVEDGSTVTFSILNLDDREMTIVPKGVKQRAIILTKS